MNSAEILKNCTGTISEHLQYEVSKDTIIIEGTIVIENFVRTGENPGVKIALPDGKKSKYAVSIQCAGFNKTSDNGENFRFGECTRLYIEEGSTTFTIDTTETINRMESANEAVFQVAPIIMEVI